LENKKAAATKSYQDIVGKQVKDINGNIIGEIESVDGGSLTIVRGVLKIERAVIPTNAVSTVEDSFVILQTAAPELTWKDIGVRCEKCGKYTSKPKLEFGHYFCSKDCKKNFASTFLKRSLK
jgi:sporulation protein YlmC with PRC-barrel domain